MGQGVFVGMLGCARERVIVRFIWVEECGPRLSGGARQSHLAMVLEYCVARSRGCVSDEVWRVHFQFCGDDESHAVVTVGVVDLKTQLGIRDSIREVPQRGLGLSFDHLRVDRESFAGGTKVIQ